MNLNKFWTPVNSKTKIPVPPLDCNEDGDEGMLVYRSFPACLVACKHQFALYGVECEPWRLKEITKYA